MQESIKSSKIICPCCNKKVTSLRDRKNEDKDEILSACEDCWEIHDKLWYYLSKYKHIPYYKGIKIGQKIWCNLGYERDLWFKGIVNKISISNTNDGIIYIYECYVEDFNQDDMDLYVTLEIVDEEDIRYRNQSDFDSFDKIKLDLDLEIEETKLDKRLCDNCYIDEL